MHHFVFGFQEIDKTLLPVVGGKGAARGKLCRIEGNYVPDGFCISVEAFKRIIAETPSLDEWLAQLSLLNKEDQEQVRDLSARIRERIEGASRHQ